MDGHVPGAGIGFKNRSKTSVYQEPDFVSCPEKV